MPLRGKILNTWEVDSTEILASQEVHDISVHWGWIPRDIGKSCATTKFAFSPMPTPMACILPPCSCALFVVTSARW